jgi:hypothetical protein
MITGAAPQTPPQNVFAGVRRFSRVDHVVVEDRRRGQHGRQPVAEDTHQGDRDHREGQPEDQYGPGRDAVGRQRAPLGAPHELVDIAVDVAVQGARRAAREGSADQHHGECAQVGPATGGQHHRRHRGDQQQLDDLRLGQREVGAQDDQGISARFRALRLRGALLNAGRPSRDGTLGDHAHGQPPSGIGTSHFTAVAG